MIPFLFSTALFTSSFLLFLIQPMMGKYLLPFFGGSASVWTVAMLFFMTALLAGYVYAHFLAHLKPRSAFAIHTLVLLFAAFLFWRHFQSWGTPIFQSAESIGAVSAHPTRSILFILTSGIGIPYFALSATSSFLQVWYSRISRHEPFWLYALSNVASLCAIISYPFLIEPFFSLRTQSLYWSLGFAFFGILMFVSMAFFIFTLSKEKEKIIAPKIFPSRISAGMMAVWFGYSTLGALLLLVFTTYATRSVASVPFLWMLPLSLYLISFAVTFTGASFYRREFFVWSTAGLVLGVAAIIPFHAHIGTLLELFILHAALFSSLVFCHGELYSRRPDPASLTDFYLVISFGGVMAGILATVLAPVIFNGYWEFHITLFVLLISVFWYVAPSRIALLRGAGIAFVLGVALIIANRFGSAELSRNFYGVLTVFTENTLQGEIRSMANGVTVHSIINRNTSFLK